MKIHLLAVGTRMPAWVQQGYQEYARRLPPECGLVLKEIPPGQRGKSTDLARTRNQEWQRMRTALPKNARLIALDESGQPWSTRELAQRLEEWMADGRDPALLVGGPDGLDAEGLGAAENRWSLSALTLPHPLVRILVAEQIYRAWSVLRGHPYHRA
ncbi:MAG: 23S rRNA (pseudouridine(1915)-N(3))-methyltransferase RlmH [Pseudomonadota bacterium]